MGDHILVAGTFDHIHKGHEKILRTALGKGQEITIGLTSNIFTSTYKHGVTLPYDERKARLEAWLAGKTSGKTVHIRPIDDPYGPATTGQFDDIVVSTQTRARAEEINNKRKSQGLPPVTIVEVPMVLASDGEPISSTRVRDGVIDTSGRLVMPDSIRDELIRPVGTLLIADEEISKSMNETRGNIIVSVGDVTTTRLMETGITPSLAIVDLLVQRKPFKTFDAYGFSPSVRIVRVASGPGFIADTAAEGINDWATDVKAGRNIPYAIIVQGEEDLLVLPAIVAAPVGAIVYYGQPTGVGGLPAQAGQSGLVCVTVTHELQTRISEILSRFIPRKGGE